MRRRFVFWIGIIIFIAFIWLVTTIGVQSAIKKEKPVASLYLRQQKIENFYSKSPYL